MQVLTFTYHCLSANMETMIYKSKAYHAAGEHAFSASPTMILSDSMKRVNSSCRM